MEVAETVGQVVAVIMALVLFATALMLMVILVVGLMAPIFRRAFAWLDKRWEEPPAPSPSSSAEGMRSSGEGIAQQTDPRRP